MKKNGAGAVSFCGSGRIIRLDKHIPEMMAEKIFQRNKELRFFRAGPPNLLYGAELKYTMFIPVYNCIRDKPRRPGLQALKSALGLSFKVRA